MIYYLNFYLIFLSLWPLLLALKKRYLFGFLIIVVQKSQFLLEEIHDMKTFIFTCFLFVILFDIIFCLFHRFQKLSHDYFFFLLIFKVKLGSTIENFHLLFRANHNFLLHFTLILITLFPDLFLELSSVFDMKIILYLFRSCYFLRQRNHFLFHFIKDMLWFVIVVTCDIFWFSLQYFL